MKHLFKDEAKFMELFANLTQELSEFRKNARSIDISMYKHVLRSSSLHIQIEFRDSIGDYKTPQEVSDAE